MIHPYGSVGEYSFARGQSTFGADINLSTVIAAAERIQTFTEGSNDPQIAGRIEEAFENCDLAMFLGFGFLPLNMDLLLGRKDTYGIKTVLGTAFKLSEDSRDLVSVKLGARLSGVNPAPHPTTDKLRASRVMLSDVSCSLLFDRHWQRLLESQ